MGTVAIRYVTIPDTIWRCSRLPNLTVILHSPTFLSLSVFVFITLHVFVILLVFSILSFMIFFQTFRLSPTLLLASEVDCA